MTHERGYWLDKSETDTHLFDAKLCSKIIELFGDKKKAIDIGCGNGAYTKALIEAGIDCKGYDGSPLTPEISGGLCEVLDFSKPQRLGRFNLVLSLEVGEHIPLEFEQIFIENVVNACAIKGYIVMSWAIEGQLGTGHVNCHNNDYIISKMMREKLTYEGVYTNQLREASELRWFKNTILVFSRWSPAY